MQWGNILLVGAVVTSAGCEGVFGVNQAQCDQSIATVRQAISFGQFDSAAQWREYAWKICGEAPALGAVEQELADAKAAAAAKVVADKQRARKLAQIRINAAQKVWLTFDAKRVSEQTAKALNIARNSASRQSKGLTDELKAELKKYNASQFAARKEKLKK